MTDETNLEGVAPTPEPEQPKPANVPGGEETPEPNEVFPRDYVEQLRNENKQRRLEYRKLETEMEALRKAEADREEAKLTEQNQFKELADKRAKELADLQAKLRAQEINTMRLKIATELGLPAALADRLRGDTEEDIREDAQALLDSLPKPAPTAPTPEPRSTRSPSLPDGTPQGETEAQKKARLLGKGQSVAFQNATLIVPDKK